MVAFGKKNDRKDDPLASASRILCDYSIKIAGLAFEHHGHFALRVYDAAIATAFDLFNLLPQDSAAPGPRRFVRKVGGRAVDGGGKDDDGKLADAARLAQTQASEDADIEARAIADAMDGLNDQVLHELEDDCARSTPPRAPRPKSQLLKPRSVRPTHHKEVQEALDHATRSLTRMRHFAGPRDEHEADAAIARVYAEFPWFQPVLADLLPQLRSSARTGHGAGFRPTLLVGPPGVGKTRFAERLARTLGVHFERHDCAGNDDTRALAGTARGWGSAEFSAPVRALLATDHANPLLFLDEIEKSVARYNHYSAASLILPWLEPSSASSWRDPFLMAPVNLAHVMWMFGANSLDSLSTPFLSRVTVHHVPAPGAAHFDALIDSILADIDEEESKRAGASYRIMTGEEHDEAERPLIEPEVREALHKRFVREPISPRELARLVRKAVAATPRRRPVSAH